MGITNFRIYAEKALKWPKSTYAYNGGREKAVTVNWEKDPIQTEEVAKPDKEKKYFSFYDHLTTLVCDMLHVSETPQNSSVEGIENRIVLGVCVDLSSVCYDTILTSITDPSVDDSYFPRRLAQPRMETETCPDNKGSSSQGARRAANNLFSDIENQAKTMRHAITGESETNIHCDSNTVEVDLCETMIEKCAQNCYYRLMYEIGPEMISKAHYLCLNYDENTTTCKWYQQYKRWDSQTLFVSKTSKNRIFIETIKKVRDWIVHDVKDKLDSIVETVGAAETDQNRKVVQHVTSYEFINNLVMEKLLLSECDTNDEITRQRYVIGEGEWKCFYTIHDARSLISPAMLQEWYVFGNDSDIGLGILLYTTTVSTRIHYVNRAAEVIWLAESIPDDRLNVYKALHFFALALIGNDYVPRLVNESEKNITCLGEEVDRLFYSKEKYCQMYVEELSNVFRYGSDYVGGSCERTDADNRSILSRALAYLFTRLLLAVYDERKTTNSAEGICDRFQGTLPVQESFNLLDKTSLRCRDGKLRNFTECFTIFVTRTLWYLAYCTFYLHMDLQQQYKFLGKLYVDDIIRLEVPGLVTKEPFLYNDPKMRSLMQFELINMIDVRRALQQLTTLSLLCITEKKVLDVLQE